MMVGGSDTSWTSGVVEGHIDDMQGSTGDIGETLSGISKLPTDINS